MCKKAEPFKQPADRQSKEKELQAAHKSSSNLHMIKLLQTDLNGLLRYEYVMWKQRSWAEWLKQGDKNMKFFSSERQGKKKEKYYMGP